METAVRKCLFLSVSDGDNAGDPDLVTYAVVKKQRKKKEPDRSVASSKQRLTDDSVIYSSVYLQQATYTQLKD
ncbi:hypothetical protein PFLUV_G00169380 [Perca fluviatilis]|uniref:Uncharacterized protein n=1 Tax=Perca fluviatilis TaxID=8168 RepID=A0A6A5EJ73_PERFL|nr:hypothetical protein PFLUV_G00169380 [Perca fluviatilis]